MKSRFELNCSTWKKYPCFNDLTTEQDNVDYLVSLDSELEETYQLYQDLLYAFQNNNFNVLDATLNKKFNNLSEYMKTSIKTLKGYTEYIKNTFKTRYHNGYVEGNNNFNVLDVTLNKKFNNLSEYMKTSIKTLKGYIEYIKNTFNTGYHNGYAEGNNNFIKVLKRIAFGFRSFTRFKARIMICKGLINPKEKEVEIL